MNRILNMSITYLLWKHLCNRCSSIERRKAIYYNSQTHKLLYKFREKVETCFRYSFLGKITEIRQTNLAFLDNSQVVQYLVNFYKGWKNKIISCSKISLLFSLTKDMKEKLYFLPVRIICIIVVVAIAVNIFLSLVLCKHITLWSWLIRGLFLFTAYAGLFCQVDWPTFKRNSVFLKICGIK